LMTPPDNIGPRSTPNYHAVAQQGVHALSDGSTVFAGQRDDPFFGDVGAIFDLVAIRNGTGATAGGKDFLPGYAVHSIALQLPISMIDNHYHVVGIWAANDRQRRSLNSKGGGNWVQVSRLGNPLVNERLILTELKDKWNRSTPDKDVLFKQCYHNPALVAQLNKLFPEFGPFKEKDRAD